MFTIYQQIFWFQQELLLVHDVHKLYHVLKLHGGHVHAHNKVAHSESYPARLPLNYCTYFNVLIHRYGKYYHKNC